MTRSRKKGKLHNAVATCILDKRAKTFPASHKWARSHKMHLNGLRLKDLREARDDCDSQDIPPLLWKVGHSSCPSAAAAASACPDSLLHPTQTNWAGPSRPHRCGDIPLPRIHTWTACKPSATEETKVSHRRAVWTRAPWNFCPVSSSAPHAGRRKIDGHVYW